MQSVRVHLLVLQYFPAVIPQHVLHFVWSHKFYASLDLCTDFTDKHQMSSAFPPFFNTQNPEKMEAWETTSYFSKSKLWKSEPYQQLQSTCVYPDALVQFKIAGEQGTQLNEAQK